MCMCVHEYIWGGELGVFIENWKSHTKYVLERSYINLRLEYADLKHTGAYSSSIWRHIVRVGWVLLYDRDPTLLRTVFKRGLGRRVKVGASPIEERYWSGGCMIVVREREKGSRLLYKLRGIASFIDPPINVCTGVRLTGYCVWTGV